MKWDWKQRERRSTNWAGKASKEFSFLRRRPELLDFKRKRALGRLHLLSTACVLEGSFHSLATWQFGSGKRLFQTIWMSEKLAKGERMRKVKRRKSSGANWKKVDDAKETNLARTAPAEPFRKPKRYHFRYWKSFSSNVARMKKKFKVPINYVLEADLRGTS